MPQFIHPTEYRFYIQTYLAGSTMRDLEETFKCRYVSLTNTGNPSVKNIYTESYAEQSGCRIFVPKQNLLSYDTSELTLTLIWGNNIYPGNVKVYYNYFCDWISGKKFEYHDTFRPDRYWQLILKDAPVIKQEKLHGRDQYILAEFKLFNWGGKPFSESQIPSPLEISQDE